MGDFPPGERARQMQLPSDTIKRGMARAGARSMWKATGLTDADINRPLVAVCHTWTDVTPCSINQRRLAEKRARNA